IPDLASSRSTLPVLTKGPTGLLGPRGPYGPLQRFNIELSARGPAAVVGVLGKSFDSWLTKLGLPGPQGRPGPPGPGCRFALSNQCIKLAVEFAGQSKFSSFLANEGKKEGPEGEEGPRTEFDGAYFAGGKFPVVGKPFPQLKVFHAEPPFPTSRSTYGPSGSQPGKKGVVTPFKGNQPLKFNDFLVESDSRCPPDDSSFERSPAVSGHSSPATLNSRMKPAGFPGKGNGAPLKNGIASDPLENLKNRLGSCFPDVLDEPPTSPFFTGPSGYTSDGLNKTPTVSKTLTAAGDPGPGAGKVLESSKTDLVALQGEFQR
uniref:Nautilin-63 (Fragments) n=1 Tax=Nautilus macromphalus TaxID=34576 RepID=NAUT_NAUMA|nr:RecName: Full=Nautilin-63; Short=N63 [Nautilus macromphalus]